MASVLLRQALGKPESATNRPQKKSHSKRGLEFQPTPLWVPVDHAFVFFDEVRHKLRKRRRAGDHLDDTDYNLIRVVRLPDISWDSSLSDPTGFFFVEPISEAALSSFFARRERLYLYDRDCPSYPWPYVGKPWRLETSASRYDCSRRLAAWLNFSIEDFGPDMIKADPAWQMYGWRHDKGRNHVSYMSEQHCYQGQSFCMGRAPDNQGYTLCLVADSGQISDENILRSELMQAACAMRYATDFCKDDKQVMFPSLIISFTQRHVRVLEIFANIETRCFYIRKTPYMELTDGETPEFRKLQRFRLCTTARTTSLAKFDQAFLSPEAMKEQAE